MEAVVALYVASLWHVQESYASLPERKSSLTCDTCGRHAGKLVKVATDAKLQDEELKVAAVAALGQVGVGRPCTTHAR